MSKLYLTIVLCILVNLTFGQEGIAIPWPEEYDWKVLSSQDNQNVNSMELIPGAEQVESWTLFISMLALKGVKNYSLDDAKKFMHEQAKKTTSCSQLTSLESNVKSKYPWMLFKIEVPCNQSQHRAESQLWFIRQGDISLYINFIAVKKSSINDEFVKKWSNIFKGSEIVTVTNAK